MNYKHILRTCLLCAVIGSSFARQAPDPAALQKIREEGLNHSKVMDLAFYLTDVNGPRLSNSPGLKKAEDWALNMLKSWGAANATLEYWGDFGKGWEQQKSYLAMRSPYYQPMTGVPKAWSGSTAGMVRSEVILVKPDSTVIANLGAALKGKIVIYDTKNELSTKFTPDAARFTEEELAAMDQPAAPRAAATGTVLSAAKKLKLTEMLYQQGAVLLLNLASGTHGTVFTTAGPSYKVDAKPTLAQIDVSSEDYLRMVRLLKAGIKVESEAEVSTVFYDDPKAYNVIAEIPGSDPKLKDEVVMLGAHLDSWHGATGATDNASGCAIMMEAFRIIKEQGLKPRRTIRLALWSSEEQGLHGSKNYVLEHFGDPATMKLKSGQKKISAYYNLDNGAGKIRGIYTQQNTGVEKIFAEWLAPFIDLGATKVAKRNTGSTDHIAFDAVGIPGFQFIQDRLEYFTRTHHSNADTYDRLIGDDLKQASVIVASFVYNTAQLNDKLPRKELPAAKNK